MTEPGRSGNNQLTTQEAGIAPVLARFAFDQLVTAWTVAAMTDPRRRVESDAELREAIGLCKDLTDYSGLPCPLDVFLPARDLAQAWLACGSNTVRRDRTRIAAEAAMQLALSHVTGSIDKPFLRPGHVREAGEG